MHSPFISAYLGGFLTFLLLFQTNALILNPNLLLLDRGIVYQLIPVQILPVHIHAGDLVVIVGGVIVDAFVGITAGGIDRDLALSVLQHTAPALLIHGA